MILQKLNQNTNQHQLKKKEIIYNKSNKLILQRLFWRIL